MISFGKKKQWSSPSGSNRSWRNARSNVSPVTRSMTRPAIDNEALLYDTVDPSGVTCSTSAIAST